MPGAIVGEMRRADVGGLGCLVGSSASRLTTRSTPPAATFSSSPNAVFVTIWLGNSLRVAYTAVAGPSFKVADIPAFADVTVEGGRSGRTHSPRR